MDLALLFLICLISWETLLAYLGSSWLLQVNIVCVLWGLIVYLCFSLSPDLMHLKAGPSSRGSTIIDCSTRHTGPGWSSLTHMSPDVQMTNDDNVSGKCPPVPGAPVWACTPAWPAPLSQAPPPPPPAPRPRRPRWCQPPGPRWSVVTRCRGPDSPHWPLRWRPGPSTPASTARSPAPASAPCAVTSPRSQSGSRRECLLWPSSSNTMVEFIKMIKLSVWKVRQINLVELQLKQCCLDVWPKIWKYFKIGDKRYNR